ncbi:hypothetical protein GCM10027359_06810 [Marilutibacter aestuarii]
MLLTTMAIAGGSGRRNGVLAILVLFGSMCRALVAGGVHAAAGRIEVYYKALLHERLAETLRSRPAYRALQLRLRRGLMPSLGFDARPAGQVHSAGHDTWAATGDDPRFVVSQDVLGSPLPAGWYRFRGRVELLEGYFVGSCLYPDYGRGTNEGALVPLGEPGADGSMDVLLVLPWQTHSLRFDPTTRRATFRLADLRLERLGRARAFLYMLTRIGTGADHAPWRARAGALARFVRGMRGGGVSNATRELFSHYQAVSIRNATGYASWAKKFDTFSPLDAEPLRQRALAMADGPLVSILLPVYQTPERWLRKCIESVIAQAYPNWELCIADDCSPSPHVRAVLDEYSARDARIKVVFRGENGHISKASNSALELATGEYIGLLDHDDELRPHALLEVVEALREQPGLRLVYSDEDKIDENGRRFDPYFKPAWDPDLLRSQNYLCHFTVVDASLVRSVGGFRAGYEGSQDHDLFLRCSERCEASEIHHVPRVLYHWRAIAGSTALQRDAKDYAADAGASAVADHLSRTRAAASVVQLPHGHYRTVWRLPDPAPKVSIIIPTRDRPDLLKTCVSSIRERTNYPDFELVIVDNQSSDPEALAYLSSLSSSEDVTVLAYDAPFNFSAINNWAVAQCRGEVVALLNNDIEVIQADWLREMVSLASRRDVGAVGAMLYYPNDCIQHAGVVLGVGGVANHAYVGKPRGYPGHGGRAKVLQSMSAVTAACLVVRKEAYLQVGGLDESFQVAFNDIDFCLRLGQAGLRNLWTPFAELYHHESASRGSDDTPEKSERFRGEVSRMEQRWGELLYADPAYNPNLTLMGTDFALAFPPRSISRTGSALAR